MIANKITLKIGVATNLDSYTKLPVKNATPNERDVKLALYDSIILAEWDGVKVKRRQRAKHTDPYAKNTLKQIKKEYEAIINHNSVIPDTTKMFNSDSTMMAWM